MAEVNYNCDCEVEDAARPLQTLAQLRQRMAIRCGFAASAANLPPGQTAEFNEYLDAAQKFLYDKLSTYKLTRYFRWELQAGVRFYDINANMEQTDGENAQGQPCAAIFNSDHLLWVGVSRGGNEDKEGEEWYPLICGIPPEAYSGGIQEAWPTHYEIRQCIEVWPAPASTGDRLRIKAVMALLPLVADDDKTTIDSELVFLQALANWRTDKGKPGAEQIQGMVLSRLGDLIAGTHHTRKYIPGVDQRPSPPRPVMAGGYLP